MAEVFRIQNRDGQGPYAYYGGYFWCEEEHSVRTGRPGPYEDGICFNRTKDEKFGFESLVQLKAWFTVKELKRLGQLGYYVHRIRNVDILSRSAKQCVFRCTKQQEFTYTKG